MDSLLDMGIEADRVIRLMLCVLTEMIVDVERIDATGWIVDIGMVVCVIGSDVNGGTDIERDVEVGKGTDIGRISMVDVLRSTVDVERVTTLEGIIVLISEASAEIYRKSVSNRSVSLSVLK